MHIDRVAPAPCFQGTDVACELLRSLPKLRSFAISLCGRNDRVDDLVQETVARALANINSFEPGSNMLAWLRTILRNQFFAEYRKRRREVEDGDGYHAGLLESPPAQEGFVHLRELRDALDRLAPDHREALILIAGSGLSYDEAAARCGCPAGTIKSRVSRARGRLAELLEGSAGHRPKPKTSWMTARLASDNDHAASGFL
jgi:RNA polymerase sigma-70 factor (ECF subfamily)